MPRRLDNLTALRFVAALSVFLHHLKAFGLNLSESVWNVNLGFTVSFFFVLSGFVLSYSYEGRIGTPGDAGRFIVVRFLRLWPLHMVCGALALVLIGIPSETTFARVVLFVTLLHAWVPSYDTAFFLNPVSWSISVEFFFYVTFALLLTQGARLRLAVMAAWVLAVAALVLFVSWAPAALPFSQQTGANGLPSGVASRSFFHLFPPVRIVEFFAGMATYSLYARVRIPERFVAAAQLACSVLVALYLPQHVQIRSFLREYGPSVFAQSYAQSGVFPLFACVVYVFAHQHGLVSKALSTPVMVLLGNVSFAFYMIHQIVITVLARQAAPTVWGAPAAAALAFVLSLAAAWVLYRAVELPALAWAKRSFARAD